MGSKPPSDKVKVKRRDMFELDEEIIEDLKSLDTPTVCNAIEVINPQRRGYGYTTKPLSCLRPNLRPLVAIARTARIRAMHPTDLSQQANSALLDQYYEYIDGGPKPSVVVIEDLDDDKGYGCFWGEVNSAIHFGMGCLRVILTVALESSRCSRRFSNASRASGSLPRVRARSRLV